MKFILALMIAGYPTGMALIGFIDEKRPWLYGLVTYIISAAFLCWCAW